MVSKKTHQDNWFDSTLRMLFIQLNFPKWPRMVQKRFSWKFSKHMLNLRKKRMFNRKFRKFQNVNQGQVQGEESPNILVYNARLSPFLKILGNADPLETGNFQTGTLTMRWKIPMWSSENLQWWMQVHFVEFQENRTALRFVAKVFENFLFEWFAVRKFNNFRIFWKLCLEISVPFVPLST